MKMQQVTVLGATGSIGQSSLDVIARHPEQFSLYSVAAKQNDERMFEVIQRYGPQIAVMEDAAAAQRLAQRLRVSKIRCEIHSGQSAVVDIARESQVDVVIAGIVGAAGLSPTLAAVQAGKRVLLANKEALVMAGRLFMEAVDQCAAQLMPVDSEHNAIFQCLPQPYRGLREAGVDKIILTGSGGPFLQTPIAELDRVSVAQACAHPNWAMGRKISVDSATMMNKGLEFIEACWLFKASPADIEIILHPQSIVHSMVRYIDGSVIAQMGQPDMRIPIAHCLGWPMRVSNGAAPLDFQNLSGLTFATPSFERFPCLRLAMDAMNAGGTYPAALNAANEIAVAAFLNNQISFVHISQIVEKVMDSWNLGEPDDLDAVICADQLARRQAIELLGLTPRRVNV